MVFRSRLGRLLFAVSLAGLALIPGRSPVVRAEEPPPPPRRRCPTEMVEIRGFCIDRWEVSTVDVKTGEALSPYYPPLASELEAIYDYWTLEARSLGSLAARSMPLPEPSTFQREQKFAPRAVSRGGVVPQGYLSYYTAKRSCESAGKRLCSEREWVTACGGERGLKFPYAEKYRAFACNVYRYFHPASALHENASLGHRDPRLNLLVEDNGDPLLRATGATQDCASRWGGDVVYDMVGNVDEWVEGEKGPVFMGGFYARSTYKGCEAKVDSHAAAYYDYSTGTRCCGDLR
jgi:formylglycine-generating enzyme